MDFAFVTLLLVTDLIFAKIFGGIDYYLYLCTQ